MCFCFGFGCGWWWCFSGGVVHDGVVFVLFVVPVVPLDVGEAISDQGLGMLRVCENVNHLAREFLGVAGFEKADVAVVEVVGVDHGAGGDDGKALGHELHDFGAVGFVAEGIGAFGDDAEIGVGDFIGDLANGQGIEEKDVIFETEFAGEGNPGFLHVAVTVNMELGGRNLFNDAYHGADGDVETLMILETAGKDRDLFAVGPCPGAGIEDVGIDVVENNRAVLRSDGALSDFFVPDVIGDDDVMGESAGGALDAVKVLHVPA